MIDICRRKGCSVPLQFGFLSLAVSVDQLSGLFIIQLSVQCQSFAGGIQQMAIDFTWGQEEVDK